MDFKNNVRQMRHTLESLRSPGSKLNIQRKDFLCIENLCYAIRIEKEPFAFEKKNLYLQDIRVIMAQTLSVIINI
jgi:hypothetical protein